MQPDAADAAATVLVVLGATGDLMARKIVPSLFYLFGKGLLPKRLWVVGFGRRPWGDAELQKHVRGILADKYPDADPATVEGFLGYFRYFHGNFDQPEAFLGLGGYLKGIDDEWGVCSNKLFYLAVPPDRTTRLSSANLADSGLTEPCSDVDRLDARAGREAVRRRRGDGAASSTRCSAGSFREEQIYRIDHYLAKEMLQGILNFRFTNNLFETEWNREAIESHRHHAARVRSAPRSAARSTTRSVRCATSGQNHLLQMLALVTMDQPASPAPTTSGRARAALIESLAPMTPGEVADSTFRAQYEGFRDIAGVGADSETETYFQLRTDA